MLLLNEVQAALFTALTAALAPVPVVDAGGSVENVAFPYATIGTAIATPANTLTEWGTDYAATVHVWSRQRGFKECNALMAQVAAALDNKRLPVDACQCVGVALVQAQPLADLDGVTKHGVIEFRVLTFQLQGS